LNPATLLATEALFEIDPPVDAVIGILACCAGVPLPIDTDLRRAAIAVLPASTLATGAVDADGIISGTGAQLPSVAIAYPFDDAFVIEATGEAFHRPMYAGGVLIETHPKSAPEAIGALAADGAVEGGYTVHILDRARGAFARVVTGAQVQPTTLGAQALLVAVDKFVVVGAGLDLLRTVDAFRLLTAAGEVTPLPADTVG